eukprot:scaffold1173_cov405-Prasinococcus_capsulatus_cf.AAC.5
MNSVGAGHGTSPMPHNRPCRGYAQRHSCGGKPDRNGQVKSLRMATMSATVLLLTSVIVSQHQAAAQTVPPSPSPVSPPMIAPASSLDVNVTAVGAPGLVGVGIDLAQPFVLLRFDLETNAGIPLPIANFTFTGDDLAFLDVCTVLTGDIPCLEDVIGTGFDGGPFELEISVPVCPPINPLSTDVRIQTLQLDESGIAEVFFGASTDIYFFQMRFLDENDTVVFPEAIITPPGSAISVADFLTVIIEGTPDFILGILDVTQGDQPVAANNGGDQLLFQVGFGSAFANEILCLDESNTVFLDEEGFDALPSVPGNLVLSLSQVCLLPRAPTPAPVPSPIPQPSPAPGPPPPFISPEMAEVILSSFVVISQPTGTLVNVLIINMEPVIAFQFTVTSNVDLSPLPVFQCPNTALGMGWIVSCNEEGEVSAVNTLGIPLEPTEGENPTLLVTLTVPADYPDDQVCLTENTFVPPTGVELIVATCTCTAVFPGRRF